MQSADFLKGLERLLEDIVPMKFFVEFIRDPKGITQWDNTSVDKEIDDRLGIETYDDLMQAMYGLSIILQNLNKEIGLDDLEGVEKVSLILIHILRTYRPEGLRWSL
jgi:hypothetical protein